MNFKDKLHTQVNASHSLLCVGLDPDMDKIPAHIKQKENSFFEFNKAIIDATHDLVCTYKPNSAFYEAEGEWGIRQLKMTCDYLKETYPQIPVLLDFKRGDIGNTNEKYAQFAFEYLQVDAVTVQPYQGKEALEAFFKRKDKGIFILCKTSNPGSNELQGLPVNGKLLYEIVAEKAVGEWNENGNCFLVVGATYPEELKKIRSIVGDMDILVPGVGKQGGDLKTILEIGLTIEKRGLIINMSRSILYASDKEDFAQKAREEAESVKTQISADS
ncbi:MAG: orotidine-5'-phosphate decarboxylase [bacterium]|nr:orotidine-5'-phosphate decarboxylase [bacterium]